MENLFQRIANLPEWKRTLLRGRLRRAEAEAVAASAKHLVAYVVPREGAPFDGEELRRFLRERLPAHMIPSSFLVLDELPLTASGKVDYGALPANGLTPAKSGAREGDTTPVGEIVTGVCAELLNSDRLDASDNFFEAGGHSLLAAQLVAHVNEIFQTDIPLSSAFECATISEFAGLVERARRAGPAVQTPPPALAPRDGELPLSFSQQRLWFIDQLRPGLSSYNSVVAVNLAGTLRADALERALAGIIERHEVLRTTFVAHDGRPRQVVAPPAALRLPLVDLRGLPPRAADARALSLAAEEVKRPFDLARGPLFRATLVQTGNDAHVLIIVTHHIVSDGWSIQLLLRELAALYEESVSGGQPRLPGLPLQYADFAHWQRRWLSDEVLGPHLSYWRKQLADAPPVLKLPFDHPRPPVETFRGATQSLEVSAQLTEKLTALSRRQGVTLFMTLLATFKALVYRYTGQEDIVVGTDVAGRNQPQVRELIGFFVNQLVLRTSLSGNPTFLELLARVRETALAAYDHQDVPFEQLVEDLKPERDLSRNPLFQVDFTLHHAASPVLRAGDLVLSLSEVDTQVARFDLEVNLLETPDGLKGTIQYNRDLFDDATITRLLAHFEILLQAVAADPARRLLDLPLLTADERALLARWNETDADYPAGLCFHQLFEEQAARTPDALAAVCGDERVSYETLNRRANHLAGLLVARGAGPEVCVAVLSERGIDLLTAVLAIFKAGAAYLPLDPGQPVRRHAQVLAQSGAPLVLASRDLADGLARGLASLSPAEPPQVLPLDQLLRHSAPAENPPARCSPRNLAYVIYTSGSTGAPKGAMVEHRGMLNHLCAKVSDLGLSEADVVAQTASQCFDISVWQYLAALLVGGCVRVFGDDVTRDASALLARVSDAGVTVLELVPSQMRLALAEASRGGPTRPDLSCLRWLLSTGEALPPEVSRQWFETYPHVPLVNAYGPTECSDDVSHHFAYGPTPDARLTPIGRPIANTRLYVLDAELCPLPVGGVGELYVGGDGVGRGYLRDAVRTAEVFVPDPFAGGGARLYRTGDLARFLPDGNLEFVGRADHQLKIRGLRIEPGEIESVIRNHAGVSDAVVLAHAEADGGQRLVAYIVQGDSADNASRQTAEAGWEREHVEAWQTVFEDAYGQTPTEQDAKFLGWNDSYTGRPIPNREMQEWVDCTVADILRLRPRRALELGCGKGLLLLRLAPHCETYYGTDISPRALEDVRRQLARCEGPPPHISLRRGGADDFTGFDDDSFDTLILNSVIQYFPSGDYLLRVLANAVRVVEPGGSIFVGDVRNLRLLEALHLSVQLFKAADSLPLAQLRERVQRSVTEDDELLIEPGFFLELKRAFPKISDVQIRLKRGRHHNELTRFRYNVVLKLGAGTNAPEPAECLDWQQQALTLPAVRALLEETRLAALCVRHIPNARLQAEVRALRLLADAAELRTVGEFRAALAGSALEAGIDPEDLWACGDDLGYSVSITPSGPGAPDCFDALFALPGAVGRALVPPSVDGRAAAATPVRPWSSYASNPLQGRFAGRLVPELRRFLQERLPDYMVPSAFVLLDALPLTGDGKLNRLALPAPRGERPDLEEKYVAPRDAVEERLAQIWAEVLRLNLVGVHDNFFEIGGHSLVAIQTISRVRGAFGVELTVRDLFEGKTVASVARRIEELRSEAERAEARVGVEGARSPAFTSVAAIEKLPPQEHYEIAAYQLPEWYLHELDPESPFYNTALGNLLFTGEMDVDAFVRAWQTLVARHSVFRTYFGLADGRPVQKVLPSLPLTRDDIYLDRTSVPEEEFHEEVQRLSLTYSGVALDFMRPPLFRVKLAEFPGKKFVLFYMIHHIIWDETSTMTLSRELSELYNAYRAGRPPALPPLELDYVDFAHWINRAIESGQLESQRQYWLGKFATIPPPLDLPLDYPRPPLQTFNGDEAFAFMPPATYAEVNAYIKRHDVTLYIFLLAILNTLIYRLTGQSDFVVGTPIANRDDVKLEHMLGLFATALPMRCTVAEGTTFARLLQLTRETAVEAFDNHTYPSVLAIQEINPRMDASRNRLFSVMYGLQNNKRQLMSDMQFDGLRMSYVENVTTADFKTSTFDLTVVVDYADDGLIVRFNYNSDLFTHATAERMIGQYLYLVEQVLRDSGKELDGYRLLAESEETRILRDFNPAPEDFGPSACAHRRFEEQSRRAPDAVAVSSAGRELTYRELDEAANRWANYLLAAGTKAEDRVGILLDPSPEMLVAALAVLKAGAGYVPISPGLPAHRQRAIAESAGTCTTLTDGRLAPEWLGPAAVPMDELAPRVSAYSSRDPGREVSPRQLAYTLFTSGTTGRPKGIEVEHRGVANLIASTQKDYGLTPRDAVLFTTPLSFDASVLETLWPLSFGARVVIPPADALKDVARLAEVMRAHGVSVFQCVPTMLGAFADARLNGEFGELPSLRLVICGGAPLDNELRDRFFAAFRCGLVNHYGPTEVTVDATRFDCHDGRAGGVVPIGRPIANAACYILDGRLRPVPVGVVGEVHVSSPGLARAYTLDPAQTAARFLPDPFSREPGARMYRTGDLGRYADDGNIHFVGRLDQQVKVRGNRVELGEVETRLGAHPAVMRCQVQHFNGSGRDDRLVAFVELRERFCQLRRGRETYRLFTLAQRGEFRRAGDRLHVDAWPEYFVGDRLLRFYWPHLSLSFPQYQFVLLDEREEAVAVGNSIPLRWDGTLADLPQGWDAGLERGFLEFEAGVRPDTLLALSGIVAGRARGRGLSGLILKVFKRLAKAHGFERMIVPVRPTGRPDEHAAGFEEWALRRRADGLLRDDWLRVHERAGGRVLRVETRSQHVCADLSSWEGWAGRTFTRSGEYQIPDALQPVRIDVEEGRGEYFDPCVWVEHPLGAEDGGGWEHVDGKALREHLGEFLPEYMIPESYQLRSTIPLTEAGKVDGRALRASMLERMSEERFVPPANPVQEQIAGIWKYVLKREVVGITDDFFDLGGHSLLAAQALAKLAQSFGVSVTLREFFREPTIKGLETIIKQRAPQDPPQDPK